MRKAGERLADFFRTPAGEALAVSAIATTMGIAPQLVLGPQQDAPNYTAQAALGLPLGTLAGMGGRQVAGRGLRGDLIAHALAELGVIGGMASGSALENEYGASNPQAAQLARQQAQLEG
jgi:hypothetical protein